MDLKREAAWRNLFGTSCAFAGCDFDWIDLAVNTAVDANTCLCIIDERKNLVIRIEHTETDYIAASVSTRDEARNDGRISEVGAWMHLTANIDATFHQDSVSKLIIADFLTLASIDALTSEIGKSVQCIVNTFLEALEPN